jgi:hypothetical protein
VSSIHIALEDLRLDLGHGLSCKSTLFAVLSSPKAGFSQVSIGTTSFVSRAFQITVRKECKLRYAGGIDAGSQIRYDENALLQHKRRDDHRTLGPQQKR